MIRLFGRDGYKTYGKVLMECDHLVLGIDEFYFGGRGRFCFYWELGGDMGR